MRQCRRLARRPAGRQEVHAGIDLPAGQTRNRCLIEGTVASERCDECGADASEWGTHGDLRFFQATPKTRLYNCLPLTAYCVLSTSCMVYQPDRPWIHRAASNAPLAKPRRSRARWTNSIVSDALSNPTVCVPGIIPALADEMSIVRLNPAATMASRRSSAVPDGASRLAA